MQCFFATYSGTISINSEIEEIKWVSSDYLQCCAPAAQKAVEFLAALQKSAYNKQIQVTPTAHLI
jgi:hypothetical protein